MSTVTSSPVVAQRLGYQQPCSRAAPVECEYCGELVHCCTTGMSIVSSINCACGADAVICSLARQPLSLWHDWNVYHTVDEGKLNETRSTSTVLCTNWTVELVTMWCWWSRSVPTGSATIQLLRCGVVSCGRFWLFCEPTTASPFGHPCSVGVKRDPRVRHDVQGDIMTERQLVLVLCVCESLWCGGDLWTL